MMVAVLSWMKVRQKNSSSNCCQSTSDFRGFEKNISNKQYPGSRNLILPKDLEASEIRVLCFQCFSGNWKIDILASDKADLSSYIHSYIH